MPQFDVAILGLGITGFTTAEYCRQEGLSVAVTDDRAQPPLLNRLLSEHPDIPVSTGAFDQVMLLNSKRIIVSPGIAPSCPIIQWLHDKNKEIISDIDLFLERFSGRLIAVTGSNGKSTTVKMLHDFITQSGQSACMIGNIGQAALTYLLKNSAPCDWVILEISSFQLHWTQNIRADIGVLLNIYPNHLDWHEGIDAYQECKCRLLQSSNSVVMPHALADLADQYHFKDKVVGWIPSYSCLNESALDIDNRIIDSLPYALHKSAIATWAIAQIIGVDKQSCIRALEEFQPWPFRCQYEKTHTGNWYNDAKSSNLAAARYAIESVSRKHGAKVIWIAGGVTKNEDFSQVKRWSSKFVSQAVIYGQDQQQFIEALHGTCAISPVKTLQDAIALAHSTMKKDDVVVFSPAAASFDQFENFQHRGQCFSEELLAVMPG